MGATSSWKVLGEGTRVTFSLPLAQNQPEQSSFLEDLEPRSFLEDAE